MRDRRVLLCNVAALAGIVLLGHGLWLWSPALSQSVLGSLVLVAAVRGRFR